MKNLLSRIHTRYMRRRLALATADLRWMERQYPAKLSAQRQRVAAMSISLSCREMTLSSADVAREVARREKGGMLA